MVAKLNLASTLGKAVSDASTDQYHKNFSPDAKRRKQEEREAARLRAKQRNLQLGELQHAEDNQGLTNDIKTQELQIVQQQNDQLMADNARQTAYSAFDRYTGDYNPRHLNTMLKDLQKNPAGKNLFGQAVRADKVTREDAELLRREGLDPDLVLSNPQMTNELIKVTTARGEVKLQSATELFKMTGYERYANSRELQRQRELAEIAKMYRTNGLRTALERQVHRLVLEEGVEPNTPEYNELFAAKYAELSADTPDNMEFKTKDEREALRRTIQEGVPQDDPKFDETYQKHFQSIIARDRQTAPSREMDEVEQTKQSMTEKAQKLGGEGVESFLDLDPTDRKVMMKFEDDIQRIERLGKLDLDAATKRQFTYIKQLLAVAEPTSEITEAETGLIDRFSKGVENYLSDNVEGRISTSAYAAYRNTIRHALFGSALTEHEIKAFNQQFGTLGQQTGPVLAQFKTAMLQLKATLESLYNVNDSYVTHFRMGVDQEQLNNIIGALDERLEYFERAQRDETKKTELDPDKRTQLDNMFERSMSNED